MTSMIMPGNVLTIWLPSVENSGDVGVALLEAGGMQATVRLILAEGWQSDVTPSGTSEDPNRPCHTAC